MSDIRFDMPLFTAAETARHLDLPSTTISRWLRTSTAGVPLIHHLDPETPRGASVPFIAVVEAHILRALRREFKLPLRDVRDTVARLRREFNDEYALASRRLATDGVALFVDVMSSTRGAPKWEQGRDGQLPIQAVITPYLKDIVYSGDDQYPLWIRLAGYAGADVIIDTRFGFGQPIFSESKVRVEDVLDAFRAGEPIKTIADEYRVPPEQVEAAVRATSRAAGRAA